MTTLLTLKVLPVETSGLRQEFIRFPYALYANDAKWVPPLEFERRQHIGPHNPYFKHARWRAWVARRGERTVGRISAQIDSLHLLWQDRATGFFGLLEAEDDSEVFAALLEAARTWLYDQGLRRIMGPFNFSINDESGLLVEGFDTPPSVMMGHAPPYYAAALERLGYTPAQDLLAYRLATDFEVPPGMRALSAKQGDRLRLRTLRRARKMQDFGILREIYNDAWSENWNYIPFTEEEFNLLGRSLAPLIDDDFVQIAEVDGEAVGMIVMLPNLNELIRDLGGRLLPGGWLKLLWRLKTGCAQSARIPLMGIRKHYQNNLFGSLLAFAMIDALRQAARRRGIREVEMSWILDTNTKMRSIIETLGGDCYKRYRIYEKMLDEA